MSLDFYILFYYSNVNLNIFKFRLLAINLSHVNIACNTNDKIWSKKHLIKSHLLCTVASPITFLSIRFSHWRIFVRQTYSSAGRREAVKLKGCLWGSESSECYKTQKDLLQGYIPSQISVKESVYWIHVTGDQGAPSMWFHESSHMLNRLFSHAATHITHIPGDNLPSTLL